MPAGEKEPGALKTIRELSDELGVAQHILRYWETRFPELRPMQRAGNRRYYRAADVALARRIHRLLNEEGYTVRGVQKLLRDGAPPIAFADRAPDRIAPPQPAPEPPAQAASAPRLDLARLMTLRNRLAAALDS